MAETTGIEWADSTANLWIGCQKVSPGCDHCYAEAEQDWRRHRVTWGPRGERSYCKEGWNVIRKAQRQAENNNGVDPQLGRKRRIFVNSLSDFFDNHPSVVWRHEAFRLFEACPDVILILVTKRPENVMRMVPEGWLLPGGWPAHVWLLVSAEDQERADHRIPILRSIPGVRVRGVSIEPMLGSINLRYVNDGSQTIDALSGPNRLNWVIVGGESGPKARPMHPRWVAWLQDQCEATGTPFLFKQWGEFHPASDHDFEEMGCERTPDAIYVSGEREFRPLEAGWRIREGNGWEGMCRLGKKRAGRLIDGREWSEFPA